MRLRAPCTDDAPAVLAVLEARDMADLGVVDCTLEDLLDQWRALDLKADAVVAESGGGELVAYATVQRPGSFMAVAPAHEGGELEGALLRWVEARERALGRGCHRQWLASGNSSGQAVLRAAGYRIVRSYWRMARALDGGSGAVAVPTPLPAGVTVRPVDVERDAAAAHALDQASFAANPDYEPESLEEFREEHLQAHDFDPGLSLVAETAGGLAGVLLARRWVAEAVGFVDILAVHPDAQGRGLGTALLAHAFAGFAAAGLREAQLGVASDNPRALALYERAGMAPKFRADTFERPMTFSSDGERA